MNLNRQKGSKVSVVIPLYNQKRFIGEAIESILNQTYNNCEIIVVNDGSTDDPSPVLKKYTGKIHLINQDNRGLSGARNTGIKYATGKYIQLLDADDFLHKDKIAKQVVYHESNGKLLSYCEIARYYGDIRTAVSRDVGKIKDMFPQYYNFWNTYPTPIHSLLFSKEIFDQFGLFDEELKANEDRYFLSKLAAAGIVFNYIPIVGGYYRFHDHNMNRQRMHIMVNTIRYFEKISLKLGGQFFKEKFGHTSYEMMCANMTCMFFSEIAKGEGIKEIAKTRQLMKEKGIEFYRYPVPKRLNTFNLGIMFLISYLKRLKR